MNRPLLIVLTPVRNEAWILHAFLKATSLWADYIIIADQMSTDGSREIYPQYEKVIVVDNPREEMHQARSRQLLFEAAKKIKGDKILFALDADEFLLGDFMNTTGWQTILNSESGDVFWFRWINLLPQVDKYTKSHPLYWVAHLSENDMNGVFPDNHIHEWRLPWPKQVKHEYIIDDISFIHFARVNEQRQVYKEIFYQVSTAFKDDKYSGIKLFRHYQTYHPIKENEVFEVPKNTFIYYKMNDLDVLKEIDLNDVGKHYIDSVLRAFDERGIKYFAKLDIWNNDFVKRYNLHNPQSLLDKLVMLYLRFTKKWTNTILVKSIDYVLKRIY